MAELYGGMIAPHCINCFHSEMDAEYGYVCQRDSFPKVCSNYTPDEKFIRRDIENFLRRYKLDECKE